jgi:hypothetical protein
MRLPEAGRVSEVAAYTRRGNVQTPDPAEGGDGIPKPLDPRPATGGMTEKGF